MQWSVRPGRSGQYRSDFEQCLTGGLNKPGRMIEHMCADQPSGSAQGSNGLLVPWSDPGHAVIQRPGQGLQMRHQGAHVAVGDRDFAPQQGRGTAGLADVVRVDDAQPVGQQVPLLELFGHEAPGGGRRQTSCRCDARRARRPAATARPAALQTAPRRAGRCRT